MTYDAFMIGLGLGGFVAEAKFVKEGRSVLIAG